MVKRNSMKKIFVASFLFLCFVYLAGNAYAYTSPGRPTGFVNDFAGILSPSAEQTVNNQLTAFARDESNEISVVTISSLGNETIESYSEQLFKEWGIGQAKQDNGVLLLIAPNDRQVRIEVGYGLEGALTDLESDAIRRNIITPAFQQGNFDEGTMKAVAAIQEAVAGEYEPAPVSKIDEFMRTYENYFGLFFLIIFGVLGELLAAMIRATSRSHVIWPGGAVGGIGGLTIGGLVGVALGFLLAYIIGGVLIGLLIDYILSRNMVVNKWAKELGKGGGGGLGFFGFGGGGRGGGGGFGGFGGGMSGGGGSSGRW